MACMICQRSLGVWPRLLGYWAWPFMKSRKYGRGQMSCNKLTMPWGLYWKASNSSKQYPIGVPKGYGTSGHTWPRCPLPLQWLDSLSLVWEGGPEWGDSHQPPLDGALKAWPGVQQMLQLPINLIRYPLLPQPAELSTLRGGRPQWVSLIRVTTSRRQAELISPNWESEWRGQEELGFPWAVLLGHPHPLAWPWRRTRWRRCHPPTHNVLPPAFPHILTWRLHTTPESHKTSASHVGLYKLKIES